MIQAAYANAERTKQFSLAKATSLSLSAIEPLKYGFCKKYFDRNEPLTS